MSQRARTGAVGTPSRCPRLESTNSFLQVVAGPAMERTRVRLPGHRRIVGDIGNPSPRLLQQVNGFSVAAPPRALQPRAAACLACPEWASEAWRHRTRDSPRYLRCRVRRHTTSLAVCGGDECRPVTATRRAAPSPLRQVSPESCCSPRRRWSRTPAAARRPDHAPRCRWC